MRVVQLFDHRTAGEMLNGIPPRFAKGAFSASVSMRISTKPQESESLGSTPGVQKKLEKGNSDIWLDSPAKEIETFFDPRDQQSQRNTNLPPLDAFSHPAGERSLAGLGGIREGLGDLLLQLLVRTNLSWSRSAEETAPSRKTSCPSMAQRRRRSAWVTLIIKQLSCHSLCSPLSPYLTL